MTDTKELIERMESARDFPNNTCGASRHAQEVAEQLIEGRLIEPELAEHVGESIAATVAALWEARTKIARLEAERDELRGTLALQQRSYEREIEIDTAEARREAMEECARMAAQVASNCESWEEGGDFGSSGAYAVEAAIRAAMQGK